VLQQPGKRSFSSNNGLTFISSIVLNGKPISEHFQANQLKEKGLGSILKEF